MSFIEKPKTYTGHDLETIFFRPMLCGPSAEELGVRILYNLPTPTTVQLWESPGNVLQKYAAAGWNGGWMRSLRRHRRPERPCRLPSKPPN